MGIEVIPQYVLFTPVHRYGRNSTVCVGKEEIPQYSYVVFMCRGNSTVGVGMGQIPVVFIVDMEGFRQFVWVRTDSIAQYRNVYERAHRTRISKKI